MESPPAVERQVPSAEYVVRLCGLDLDKPEDRHTYANIQREIGEGLKRLETKVVRRVNDESRPIEYSLSRDLTEVELLAEIIEIFARAQPDTRRIYSTCEFDTGDNWIIRCVLFQKLQSDDRTNHRHSEVDQA